AASPGARIQRTMGLLATSTPECRNKVKILFYGQSIVRQDYARKAVEANLRKRFPNADLVVENRAIGGYEAPLLIRTAEQDLYPCYPDLVVFHVYGGQRGEFEGILRNIRERTTAEILTWTHHIDRRGPEQWEAACKLRLELAEKYGCEMVDLRAQWALHMKDKGITPEDLTVDVVHLNKAGGKLMGDILVSAFQYHPEIAPKMDPFVNVHNAEPAFANAGTIKLTGNWQTANGGLVATRGTLKLTFTGNRVDVTACPVDGKAGRVKVLIDGKAPSAHATAYAATLPTRSPIDYRPAIKTIGIGADPKVETWTLTARAVSDDGKAFAYDLAGSLTGPDGSGSSKGEFVSNSGRIRLQPRDFSFAEAIRIRKKPMPETFDVTWSVYLMGLDHWQAKAPAKKGEIVRDTLIQGIPAGTHTLELILEGDGTVGIHSLTTHLPPLAKPTF
ncbi:MAG: hypothetical protein KAI66_14100, partial [Lentisphaeria bacterium]|nr:hypothetical protein [Lentisphaeria bacterium]